MFITAKYKMQKSSLGDNLKILSTIRTGETDLGYHSLNSRQSRSGSLESRSNMTATSSLSPTPTRTVCSSASSTMTKSVHGCRVDEVVSNFQRLTDELILKIFKNLSANELAFSCTRVCRRWYYLSWTPTLWRNITFTDKTIDIDEALKCLLRLLSRELYYRDSAHDNVIARNRFKASRKPPVILVEHINLNGCLQLTDKGLILISRKCPELKSISLRACLNITDFGIHELLTSCLMLEKLNVAGCSNLRPTVGRLPQVAPNLHHLDLSYCKILDDSSLRAFLRCNGLHLTHLYLRKTSAVTDGFVKCLTTYCPLLKEISLSDCYQITDYFCYELSARVGLNLRYLSLAKCSLITNAGIKQIAKNCQKLRYLNIRGCRSISDEGLVAIAKSCGPRLKSLDIGQCDITDEGLKTLGDNCPNLKKLSVRECMSITNVGISLLAYYCRSLVSINFINCANITAEAPLYVKRFCTTCSVEYNCV